jgi:hypothetical protein
MKKLGKFVIGLVVVIFLTTAYSVGTKATEATMSSSGLIEVCSRDRAYVPPGTRYVTCRGKIMKVLGMAPMADGAEAQVIQDCFCPKCCGGTCAVIVSCESLTVTSSSGPDCGSDESRKDSGGLCTMYLACGD